MTYEEIQKMVKIFGFAIVSGFGATLVPSLYYMVNKLPSVEEHNIFKRKVNDNATKYSKQINEYNKYISQYCDEIKKLNLSDLELFIKLFDDLWKHIDGYYITRHVILGFERLYLYKENKGCCRHFVDDMVAKLNYINPKYNATRIIVYADVDNIFNHTYYLPIKRRTLLNKHNEEVSGEYDDKKYGNHAVCAVDIPGKNITLMLDPTNNVIGYFKGKKIITFGGNKTSYKYIKKENYITNKTNTFIKHEVKTGINKLELDGKINGLYGKEAQEQAYWKVSYIDGENKGFQKSL